MNRQLLCMLTVLLLSGCNSSWTIDLSNANSNVSPQITPTQLYTDWTEVTAGVEFKQVLVDVGSRQELFDLVRIDPTLADIQVMVDEANPRSVADWQEYLDSTVVINASYFDEAYQLVTRTQTTTDTYGPLLSGNTGFFYQTTLGWQLTDLAPTEVEQLIQSYPLLVEASQAVVVTNSSDRAQRTVVATDAAGQVYFIIAEYGVLTMAELAASLADWTDLNMTSALNLDGGSSTGLIIASDQLSYSDNSFVVPAVLVL